MFFWKQSSSEAKEGFPFVFSSAKAGLRYGSLFRGDLALVLVLVLGEEMLIFRPRC